jgi:predicted nucleic acid-binding protein
MLIDSNIIIYAAQPEHDALRALIAEQAPAISAVSYVEVLGYHGLSAAEEDLFRRFFARARMLPIDREVLDAAVSLRRRRRMYSGDALIAATALVHRLTLVTHNVADYSDVPGLAILDPLEAGGPSS